MTDVDDDDSSENDQHFFRPEDMIERHGRRISQPQLGDPTGTDVGSAGTLFCYGPMCFALLNFSPNMMFDVSLLQMTTKQKVRQLSRPTAVNILSRHLSTFSIHRVYGRRK
jgi:hypothetical protein